MTKTRRWLSLLVAACLTLSLFPAGAVAEENVQGSSSTDALNLGAGVIAEGDTVYFGTYDNGTVSWNVLSTEGNGGRYSIDGTDNTTVKSSDALFLLSDTAWGPTLFGSNSTYSGSTLQTTLLGYVNDSNFSALEQAAILKTSKDKDDSNTELFGYTYTNPGLSNDTLFALSAAELVEYLGYVSGDPDSYSYSVGATSYGWWLRSADTSFSYIAGTVTAGGYPYQHNVDLGTYYVRPAFNLNLNSVLFTSAAEDGKDGTTGELSTVSGYTGSAWKLTLKDESRNFAIGTTTVNGNTITVTYSRATIGSNEYISAIVTDSDGNITYYGRIKSMASATSTSGTVQITLPTGFNSSTDTLYLFSEQYNGDKNTDYASELQEVALYSVTNSLTNITTDNSATFCSTTSDYTATLSASDDYTLPDSIVVTAGGNTLTAETDYIYDSSTGALTIYAFAITGDIVITAQAVLVDTGDPSTGTEGSEGGGSTAGSTGTTASGITSTSSDTSTSSASSDSSLPQTGDTSTVLLLGTVVTLGLSALAIALSLAQRRRNRIQGAHVRMR